MRGALLEHQTSQVRRCIYLQYNTLALDVAWYGYQKNYCFREEGNTSYNVYFIRRQNRLKLTRV